jgi:hypothetical protein
MANSTSAEIGVARAAITGAVFVAPLGTALPTDALAAKNVAFVNLGYVGEEGIQPNREVSTEDKKDMNGDTVYTVQTDFVREYQMTFLQVGNVDLKKLLFGSANVVTEAGGASQGAQIAVEDKGQPAPHRSFVIDTEDGDKTHREVIPDGQVSSVELGPLVGTDTRSYTVTIKTFKDSDGTFVYEYDDDGVLVP